MALNCSSCSFLASDDCTVLMCGGGGYWPEEAAPPWSCGWKSVWWEELDDYCDPVDLLPSDPFGMNLGTTFSAAMASCIGDLTVMSGREALAAGGGGGGDALFADLNCYLNRAFMVSPQPHIGFGGISGAQSAQFSSEDFSGQHGAGSFPGSSGHEPHLQSGGFMQEPLSFGNSAIVYPSVTEDVAQSNGFTEGTSSFGNAAAMLPRAHEGGVPHEGMLFALCYLGLRDLLSVEMACKSLHTAVRNDPLLWRCIHIDSYLSEKITDDDLLRLTQKTQGFLQCLSLVGCSNITDQGLQAVLLSNPRLVKLNVAGCMRLSIEGLITNLKLFNSQALVGLKNLRLGKLFSVAQEHFEELLSILSIDKLNEQSTREPQFYHINQSFSDCGNKCALDIEMCPLCQKYKVVYDCPSESCRGSGRDICRACNICILRCVQCGKCIENSEYIETFCLEYLCSRCWKNPLANIAQK